MYKHIEVIIDYYKCLECGKILNGNIEKHNCKGENNANIKI